MSKSSDYVATGAIAAAVLAGAIALAIGGLGAMLWAVMIFGIGGVLVGGFVSSILDNRNNENHKIGNNSIGKSNIGLDAQYQQQKYSDDQIIARQNEHQQQIERQLENADEYRTSFTSRYYTEPSEDRSR